MGRRVVHFWKERSTKYLLCGQSAFGPQTEFVAHGLPIDLYQRLTCKKCRRKLGWKDKP